MRSQDCFMPLYLQVTLKLKALNNCKKCQFLNRMDLNLRRVSFIFLTCEAAVLCLYIIYENLYFCNATDRFVD